MCNEFLTPILVRNWMLLVNGVSFIQERCVYVRQESRDQFLVDESYEIF